MRKIYLITLIISAGMTASAQTKPIPPQYKKVVVIPIEDYQTLAGALNDSKASVIYNPQLTSDQKVQQQQAIDAYLRELPKRVKIDSVKVDKQP
jgi:hypothetical protein